MKSETTVPTATDANAVAKLDADAQLVVQDPFSPGVYYKANDINAMIASARARLYERKREFDALGKLDEAPLDALKAARAAIKADDDALLAFDGDFKNALVELSGFRAFEVQTRGDGARIAPLSVRGILAEMRNRIEAEIKSREPAKPTHTYLLRLTCTDDTLAKVANAAVKAGATDVLWCAPQTDKAVKAAQRIFEENV